MPTRIPRPTSAVMSATSAAAAATASSAVRVRTGRASERTGSAFDQFLDAARKLTNPAKGQWGVLITPNSQYDESNLIYTFGGRNFSDDLKKSLWDSDEVAQAIQ